MSAPSESPQPAHSPADGTDHLYSLRIVLDPVAGGILFSWAKSGANRGTAVGVLSPYPYLQFAWFSLVWEFKMEANADAKLEHDRCNRAAASVRAMVKRIINRLPLQSGIPVLVFRHDTAPETTGAIQLTALEWPPGGDWPLLLGRLISEFIKVLESIPLSEGKSVHERGKTAIRRLVQNRLRMAVAGGTPGSGTMGAFVLSATFDTISHVIVLDWSNDQGTAVAQGRISCSGKDELLWELEHAGRKEPATSTRHPVSILKQLASWKNRFPADSTRFSSRYIKPGKASQPPKIEEQSPLAPTVSPWPVIEDNILSMVEATELRFSPFERLATDVDPPDDFGVDDYQRRLWRKEQRREEEEARRREKLDILIAQRRAREQKAALARRTLEASSKTMAKSPAMPAAAPLVAGPLPPVPLRLEMPAIALQKSNAPTTDLRSWMHAERAARWWISNQSDDLLALAYCRIQKLDYQTRTALRVLGPLRGRALLSDEVGLGKTIEAGLVLKEWLTRGMVKRFLVLTVPSLVDQWEEELADKFNVPVVTTNHAVARGSNPQFWREHNAIVASLHTLKQPAQLEVARSVHWDLVIVDEAHHLRNRESQAWQAVNALPRQFLLLLTATPVQNSIEELYNLVTLLQPGQLPTPKEFRARYIDPKRPRQPREPEELRRLLNQVMIRNTRANAGINLPPRRAETVVFEAQGEERAFWQTWESEFRAELARLSASQASLWGRLLLQASGSSPFAWKGALEKFPNRSAAAAWRERAPLEASWQRKCELLPPLTRAEGGIVVFTQFLDTQAALADALRAARIETFLVNGSTPAAARQPIVEQFQKSGGALLLTQSGTEGRNLQFCHRLVNFDLPWNPMEIEQRIGRLHRLGQKHPVHIYNLVQSGTLQEHLLHLLQEKLNLFELVVGETGLVLGERFSSDEFAEEVLRRWRESDGRVAEALQSLGEDLAAARDGYRQVQALDETLFAKDYETL